MAAGSSSHLHLEKCIRTGPGSPGPARRGKQRRPHRSPPRTFPAASGSAQGCTAPPNPAELSRRARRPAVPPGPSNVDGAEGPVAEHAPFTVVTR